MLGALARGARLQLQHVRCMTTAAAAPEANPVATFLKNASRPKIGLAKAKQSAGQRAIDLTKHAPKFADMSFEELMQVNGKALTKLNVPCQDRKRLLRMAHKAKQGWVHDGKERPKHAWKGWKPPEWLPGADRGIPS